MNTPYIKDPMRQPPADRQFPFWLKMHHEQNRHERRRMRKMIAKMVKQGRK